MMDTGSDHSSDDFNDTGVVLVASAYIAEVDSEDDFNDTGASLVDDVASIKLEQRLVAVASIGPEQGPTRVDLTPSLAPEQPVPVQKRAQLRL